MGAWEALDAALVIAGRELKKWVGRRPVLVVSLLTPLIWIALFGKSFDPLRLIQPPPGAPPSAAEALARLVRERVVELFGASDYFTYFSAGMIVVFALFQSMFSGVSVVFDKRLGYMDRLLASPVPRSSIFAGKILAALARITVLGSLLLAAALAMGMKLREGITPLDLLASWGYVMLLAAGLSSAYTAMAFYAENQEVLFAVSNLLNLPLMFTSSAIFPPEQMPDWLRAAAKANPITYAADLVRHHLIGKPLQDYTGEALALATVSLTLLALGAAASLRWMKNR